MRPRPVFLVVALAMVLGPTTVLASHSGEVGALKRPDGPGASCLYHRPHETGHRYWLSGFTVKAPAVFAADSSAGVDRSAVDWRFVVQMAPVDGDGPFPGWDVGYVSPWQSGSATDARPAAFHSMAVDLARTRDYLTLRVVIHVAWHRSGKVVGRASYVVARYRALDQVIQHGCDNHIYIGG